MRNTTSSVPSVPSTRRESSLSIRHKHSLVTPAHPPTIGHGSNGWPNIWEDAWEYELDRHGLPEPLTEPSKLASEPGRNVVVFEHPKLPEPVIGSERTLSESPLKRILADMNARAMTPRQMQDLSLDLYVNGILAWDEHADLAFQADLHPDFARTIGALTGEKALPDQPRDFVREWEQRLDFERRFAPAKSRAKERALHILSVLRRIEKPASLLA